MGHGKRAVGPELVALGLAIRQRREDIGLSQVAVYSAANLPRSTYSDIERGLSAVDTLHLSAIAKVLGTTGSDLMAGVNL